MDSQAYKDIVSWLVKNGYDTDRLELMPQPESSASAKLVAQFLRRIHKKDTFPY